MIEKMSEVERQMIRKYGVGLRIHKRNGSDHLVCNIWKEISDQPSNKLEEELANYLTKKRNLKFGFFDMSRPGKPQFSRKSYVWYKIEKCKELEEVESLVKIFLSEVKDIEYLYEVKSKKLVEKVLKLPQSYHKSVIEKLLNE